MLRLRNYFLTGLVTAGPLFLTVYLTWAFIVWIDSWVPASFRRPIRRIASCRYVPGFGLVVALVFITLLGFLTANLVGRTFVTWGECCCPDAAHPPIYRGLKQIIETAISNRTELQDGRAGRVSARRPLVAHLRGARAKGEVERASARAANRS